MDTLKPLIIILVSGTICLLFSLNSSKKIKRNGGVELVEYSLGIKSLSFVFLILLGVMILALSSKQANNIFEQFSVPIFFGSFLIYMIPETFFKKVKIYDSTFEVISPWRKNCKITPSDIIKINYSDSLQWHSIKTKNNGTIYLHDYLRGKDQLIERMLKHSSK
ncbi:MAG: hypothetical protein OCC49_10545 [Fibrobacterales bacterium]